MEREIWRQRGGSGGVVAVAQVEDWSFESPRPAAVVPPAVELPDLTEGLSQGFFVNADDVDFLDDGALRRKSVRMSFARFGR